MGDGEGRRNIFKMFHVEKHCDSTAICGLTFLRGCTCGWR